VCRELSGSGKVEMSWSPHSLSALAPHSGMIS